MSCMCSPTIIFSERSVRPSWVQPVDDWTFKPLSAILVVLIGNRKCVRSSDNVGIACPVRPFLTITQTYGQTHGQTDIPTDIQTDTINDNYLGYARLLKRRFAERSTCFFRQKYLKVVDMQRTLRKAVTRVGIG